MNNKRTEILLIEDNPGDARLIREVLGESAQVEYQLESAGLLSKGLECLVRGGIDVVLLDLGLPDSQGLDTLGKVATQAPAEPIVVLTGLDDEALALQAVRQGAQDYLVKGDIDCKILWRSVRYAIERKQAQQAQERLSQQLQEKVTELEAFSYAIAHDLRSPLVSIQGFVQMLQADIQNQKTERVHKDIRLIESGVNKMRQLIKASLEYSRAGQLVNPSMDVSFGKIVKEVVKEFAEQVRSIGATIFAVESFPSVYADEIRMGEVMTNLIQNSINYRDKNRPLKIEIGYQLSKNEVGFFVRDNGVGIDMSEAEKVFELFYRGTSDGEGSGAGLAIVKRIIEAHDGRIWAEGQSGKGTIMCFTLPQQSTRTMGNDHGKN